MPRFLRTKLYTWEKGKFKGYWGWTSWMDLMNKSLGIPATSWEMIIKACSLDGNLKL